MAELRENLFGASVPTEYVRLLKDKSSIALDRRFEPYHNSVCSQIKNQIEKSNFYKDLSSELSNWNDEYTIEYKHSLLQNAKLNILVKPLSSLIDKSYRHNIRKNKDYPNEPPAGWLLPDNWYCGVSDLVRTTLIVKYLDGVDWLSNKILELSKFHGLYARIDSEATAEGYYAYHVEVRLPIVFHDMNFNELSGLVKLEIQITTQIKDALKEILHVFYAESRSADDSQKWMWDYKSDRFVANNLGHMLHYVDGMIVQVREKSGEK